VIAEADYFDAVSNYIGYCTKCEDFTRECTEPDAEHYDCPECDGMTVCGAEQAMLLGLFDIEFV